MIHPRKKEELKRTTKSDEHNRVPLAQNVDRMKDRVGLSFQPQRDLNQGRISRLA